MTFDAIDVTFAFRPLYSETPRYFSELAIGSSGEDQKCGACGGLPPVWHLAVVARRLFSWRPSDPRPGPVGFLWAPGRGRPDVLLSTVHPEPR